MKKLALAAAAVFALTATNAQAMNCNAVFDELATAVGGKTTMSTEKRVALTRMATHAYDACMAGDHTTAKTTRKMVMSQISKHLGGN